MAEGWRWGRKRDAAAKEHTDPVPYSELSKSEKEYDRKAVMETVKAILAPGFGTDTLSSGVCPHKGIAVFGIEEALFSRGREAVRGRISNALRERIMDPEHPRFIAICRDRANRHTISVSGRSSETRNGQAGWG